MIEVTKMKSGNNAFKDSKKRSSVVTFYIYSVFPSHFELSLFKKLTILVRVLIKPGIFFKFQSLLIFFEVLTDASSCHSAL